MVPPAATRHPQPMTTETTHIPEIRRLRRSRSDRMLAGVSGGLAEYFEIHPAVFRVGFVVLTLLGGAGVIVYAAAALVIPDEGKDDSIVTAALRNRRDRPWPLIGVALLAVALAALLSRVTFWPDGDSWFLFLLAGAVILWITRHPAADPAKSTTELAAEDSRRVRRVVKGVVITLATLFAIAIAAVATFAWVFDVHTSRGVGDRTYLVGSTSELKSNYRLSLGTLDLDLGGLELPPGETHLNTSVDVGKLHIVLPPDTGLRVHGTAEIGDVELPAGVGGEGRNVESDFVRPGQPVLVLDAHVGVGSVEVERVVR